MFTTAVQALSSKAFIGQLIVTMLINFGVNFGFAWGTYSEWGGHTSRASWPVIYATQWNPELNSSLAMDVPLTSFLLACLCTLLATNGAMKDVRDKKCDMLDSRVTATGWWLYTPVRVHNLLLRSLAAGVYFTILVGIPTFFLLWACTGNNGMPGFAYVMFKGFWAMALSASVYVCVFMAAIDRRNFPELEFESLQSKAGGEIDATPIPLVGNVARV